MNLNVLQNRILTICGGNPGAINVVCAGVKSFGEPFLSAIEKKGWRGSEIWVEFKDNNGQDLKVFAESMGVSV